MAANSRRLVLRFESHLGRFIFGFERPSIASAVFVSLLIGIAPPPHANGQTPLPDDPVTKSLSEAETSQKVGRRQEGLTNGGLQVWYLPWASNDRNALSRRANVLSDRSGAARPVRFVLLWHNEFDQSWWYTTHPKPSPAMTDRSDLAANALRLSDAAAFTKAVNALSEYAGFYMRIMAEDVSPDMSTVPDEPVGWYRADEEVILDLMGAETIPELDADVLAGDIGSAGGGPITSQQVNEIINIEECTPFEQVNLEVWFTTCDTSDTPCLCCGSSNPCCSDPCCGDLCCKDRCCQGSSCCGNPDPCCDSSDRCCGIANRCCNPDNPCCGSDDPCCNSSDECCGNANRCCNPDNPCCGSTDPCCNLSDDCCGNSDPCCNPDNPCCGSTDPCCGNPDPCCGVDCDDGDACTVDGCVNGSCTHTSPACDDDGNPCTIVICINGICQSVDKPDCTACGGSGEDRCLNGGCVARTCGFASGPIVVCPDSTQQVPITVTCGPAACDGNMTITGVNLPPGWALNGAGSCTGGTGQGTGILSVTTPADADPGTTVLQADVRLDGVLCQTANVNVMVPALVQLPWRAFSANSTPLELQAPNNGGVRMFPGRRFAVDPFQNIRRSVKVQAQIIPTTPGCRVYFRVWDVDDPFDQNNATMANVTLIDADTTGPDNRPTPEAPQSFSAITDAAGKARITFTVSMQPGNNYRAAASLYAADRDNTTQAHADANTPPARVTFSQMLTVWRKLHVETDSMDAVTGNEISGPFTNIVGSGTSLTEVSGVGLLDDGSKDLDDAPPRNGRFENGTLTIGTIPNTITISPITGNGNSRVVFPAASIAGLPFFAEDNDFFGNGTISGTITQVTKSGGNFVWTLSVTANSETPIDWPDFVGGTLDVGGGSNVSIVASSATAPTLTTNALNIPCIVIDDDDDTLLPKLPDTGTLASAYQPAYMVPVFDVGDNNLAVPFVLNRQSNVALSSLMDWDSRGLNSPDFWVTYLLEAYQGDTARGDYDPNGETAAFGTTPSMTGGSLIYLEVHQQHENTADPLAEEQDTVVHETGHTVGSSGDEPVTNGAARFLSAYLQLIRASTMPDP